MVGVLPSGFDLPFGTEVWQPLAVNVLEPGERAARDYFVVARLCRGCALSAAQEEVGLLAQRLAERHPDSHRDWEAEIVPLRRFLIGDAAGDLPGSLLLLWGATGMVFLVTCVNLSTLLLVRFHDRSEELAVRGALGAGRWRLLRQILTESAILGVLAGGLGVALAAVGLPLLSRLSPLSTLALSDDLLGMALGPRQLVFSILLALASSLLLTLLPAASQLLSLPDQKGRWSTLAYGSWSRLGVVVQVAAAVALLTGAGLLLQSYRHLRALELGFAPEDVLVARVTLPAPVYDRHERRIAFAEDVLEGLRALPGVEAAGATTNVPLDHDSWDAAYSFRSGRPVEANELRLTAHRAVTPGYLEALGVAPVRGRLIRRSDREGGRRVVVVSEDLAADAWPGADPIGKELRMGSASSRGDWMEVVGVVPQIREDRAAFRRTRPAWYVPYAQHETAQDLALVLRSRESPELLAEAVRRTVRQVDRKVPVHGVVELETVVAGVVGEERFVGVLLAVFAGCGLFLVAIGIFGTTSLTVARRRREIGLRLALGASAGRLLATTLAQAWRRALLGSGLGLLILTTTAGLLRRALFGVSALEPRVLVPAVLFCWLVVLAASFGPARRATRISPLETLREE